MGLVLVSQDKSSLQNLTPKVRMPNSENQRRHYVLALLKYHQGNFTASANWLDKCSAYPDQTPSCVASVHILRSINQFQMGDGRRLKPNWLLGKEWWKTVSAKNSNLAIIEPASWGDAFQ